jgi:Fe-S cluster biogenesis protein NfuA
MVNVTVESTPNPATMKFLPGRPVLAEGTANFASQDAAEASTLARRLFGIAGVRGVFFGSDFISVAKGECADWLDLETAVASAISIHFEAGLPVVGAAKEEETDTDIEDEVVARIRELIDNRVRPSVALDGGDIIFRSFDDGIVRVSLRGACAGCPSSAGTLKMGVENLLRHYVPAVQAVEAAD